LAQQTPQDGQTLSVLCPDGEKFLREWKAGVYHSQGTWIWPNGTMYVCAYKRIDIFMVKEHSLYLMERSNEVEFKYSKQ